MADHHHRRGHTVTPGVTEASCSCGHRWLFTEPWLGKYAEWIGVIRHSDEHGTVT